MIRPLAAMPRRQRWPIIGGVAALAACLSWGAAAAGPYIDVEPEVGSQPTQPGTRSPPPQSAASSSAGNGSQLIPSALPPWEQPGSAAAAAATQAKPLQPATTTAAAPASASPAAPQSAHAAATAPPPASGSTTPSQTALALPPADAGGSLGPAPLAVVRWSLNAGAVTQNPDGGLSVDVTAGQPLYLKFTIDGGQPAVDRLRQGGGPIAIDVHWARGGEEAATTPGGSGAPNLTMQLTVGRPELAATFASQVARQGYFEWHLWARKDALTRGQWTVTLTYPDGAPVQCGKSQPQPCRLSIYVT